MKLLFVHPGPLFYTSIYLRLEPLGLELVAEAARRAGHAVRLLHLQTESHTAYHRFIRNWRPDLVAFSCNYLANVPEIIDLAKATRIALPQCFICVGGHSADQIAIRQDCPGANALPMSAFWFDVAEDRLWTRTEMLQRCHSRQQTRL